MLNVFKFTVHKTKIKGPKYTSTKYQANMMFITDTDFSSTFPYQQTSPYKPLKV